MWSLDVVGSPNQDQEVERKVEELAWAVSTIYGAGGWHSGPPFKADFQLYASTPHGLMVAEHLFIGCTS